MNVIIPYKDSRWRAACLMRVIEHFRLSGFTPRWLEGGSPAILRNKGAAMFDDEIIVFNDADTLVPVDQIRKAIRLAITESGLVYAYRLYLRRNQDEQTIEELFDPPSFGCVAIRRECFDEVGGFDESLETHEDVDFAIRSQKLWPVRRVDGVAFHLWHGDRRPDGTPLDVDADKARESAERWAASTA